MVLAMLIQVSPPSVENSQLNTFPRPPVTFKVPVLIPEQTVAEDEILPPTVTESTVMVTVSE